MVLEVSCSGDGGKASLFGSLSWLSINTTCFSPQRDLFSSPPPKHSTSTTASVVVDINPPFLPCSYYTSSSFLFIIPLHHPLRSIMAPRKTSSPAPSKTSGQGSSSKVSTSKVTKATGGRATAGTPTATPSNPGARRSTGARTSKSGARGQSDAVPSSPAAQGSAVAANSPNHAALGLDISKTSISRGTQTNPGTWEPDADTSVTDGAPSPVPASSTANSGAGAASKVVDIPDIFPAHKGVEKLKVMPSQRTVHWRLTERDDTLALHSHNVEAAHMTRVGTVTNECARCKLGKGVFAECAAIPGLLNGACGNCRWNKEQCNCSHLCK